MLPGQFPVYGVPQFSNQPVQSQMMMGMPPQQMMGGFQQQQQLPQHVYPPQQQGDGPGHFQHQYVTNADVTLWMGDLKEEWDSDFIREALRMCDIEVANVKMVSDRGGKPASYCFLEFADSDSARLAMVAANGRTIPNDNDRKKFNISFANSSERITEYNLFASNLSVRVDDVDLFRVFGERYASCRGAKVYRNTDGSSREFGFIRFLSETDQQKALVEMNKHRLKGKEMILKLAQPKDRKGRFYIQNPPAGRGGIQSGWGGPMGGPQAGGFMPMGGPQFGNHGLAGYGGMMGAPFGMPPQGQFMGGPMQGGFMGGGRFGGSRGGFRGGHGGSSLADAPPPVYIEGNEPFTADEHNELVMAQSADLHMMLESSRYSRVMIPMDARPKDLAQIIYDS